jgi:hypothetical protein
MADSHRSPTISPGALALAALASAVATLLIGRFGLTGTVIGAALTPVLVALVSEAARRPARRLGGTAASRRAATRDRVGATRYGGEARRLARRQISWRRVLATGLGAFALVVAAFTFADLGLGDSVASDRRTTFFGGRESSPREEPDERRKPAPTSETPATTSETPAETTTQVPEEETEPTDTAPPTETSPTETAPTTTSPSP